MKRFNAKTTPNHKAYSLALYDRDMKPVIGYGSAGTGKTYTAIKAALEQLEDGSIQRIICIRPNVSFADKNGFLPGTEQEKNEPWVRPLKQSMVKIGYTESQIELMVKNKQIVFYCLEHIQGLTFDNAFIILDEVQNMTFEQLKVFLTRTGMWSRVVLAGDIAQISPKFHNSGLSKLLHMIEVMDMPVHTIELGRDDILRSGVCKQFIIAFEEYEALGY